MTMFKMARCIGNVCEWCRVQIQELESMQNARDQRIKELEMHLSVHIQERIRSDHDRPSTATSQISSADSSAAPMTPSNTTLGILPKKSPVGSSLSSLNMVWMNGGNPSTGSETYNGKLRTGFRRQQSLMQLSEGVVVSTPNRSRRRPTLTRRSSSDLNEKWVTAEEKRAKEREDMTKFDYKSKMCSIM